MHFARNLQRQGKAYYSINTFGDHTNSTTYNRSCGVDPHACITKEVRQWVLGSYLMAKEQASAIALYHLLAKEGSEHGYGNWSWQPEGTADVGVAVAAPEVSAGGLWSRRYSSALVLVNPWPGRSLLAMVPAVVGAEWRDLYGAVVPRGELRVEPVTATTLLLVRVPASSVEK